MKQQHVDETTLLAQSNQSMLIGRDATAIFGDTRINKIINNIEKSLADGAVSHWQTGIVVLREGRGFFSEQIS